MNLTDNELVTLLLCSDMALNDGLKPFSDVAYDALARAIFEEGKQPSDLFNLTEEELYSIYQKHADSFFKRCRTNDFHTRIPELLKRHHQLIIQLSALEDQGIHVLTRANRELYPKKLRRKLCESATVIPSVIYYAGNLELLATDKILAIVGSRNLDKDAAAEDFTKLFVAKAIADDYVISSGGAKGIDDFALQTTLKENGQFIITVSDRLADKIKEPAVRTALMNNQGLYLSLVNPDARFTGYNAMERNKIIYAAANYAMVVSCEYQTKEKGAETVIAKTKGGTWVGANECAKKKLATLLVRTNGDLTPLGNKELLATVEALEIANSNATNEKSFAAILATAEAKKPPQEGVQLDLF